MSELFERGNKHFAVFIEKLYYALVCADVAPESVSVGPLSIREHPLFEEWLKGGAYTFDGVFRWRSLVFVKHTWYVCQNLHKVVSGDALFTAFLEWSRDSLRDALHDLSFIERTAGLAQETSITAE